MSDVIVPFYFGLGNAVMFLPLLHRIRLKYNGHRITLLCGMNWHPEKLVPENMYDRICFLPKNSGFYETCRAVQSFSDESVFFHPYQGSHYLFLILFRIFNSGGRIIGHTGIPGLRGFLSKVSCTEKHDLFTAEHETDRYLLLLDKAGDFPDWTGFTEKKEIESEKFILIHPSACNHQKTPKRYPPENWVSLLQMLKKLNLKVKLIGDGAERSYCQKIIRESGSDAENIAGNVLTEKLCDTVGNSLITVGSDSGIAHIAAACGVPALVIWGPTDFNLSRPSGKNVEFLNKKFPCSPCTSSFIRDEKAASLRCPEAYCMRAVKPETVFEKIVEILHREYHEKSFYH